MVITKIFNLAAAEAFSDKVTGIQRIIHLTRPVMKHHFFDTSIITACPHLLTGPIGGIFPIPPSMESQIAKDVG